MKKSIRTDRAPAAIGPFSQGYRAGDFIFVSGQGPFDPETGQLTGQTIQEQTAQTLQNVKAILEANGAGLSDVIKVTVVLTDLEHFKPMNNVYKTFFSEPYPARICFGGSLVVPNMLVEIDATAYVGE